MADPKIGENWIDLRPMTDRPEMRDEKKYRRCVGITEVNETYVHGRSYWQRKKAGEWVTEEYPPARQTRILRHVFERRFIPQELGDG